MAISGKRASQHMQSYRILFLGSSKVGKTSIILRFADDKFVDTYSETTEDIYTRQYLVSRSLIRLELFDTCGNNEFPAMQRLVINSADAVIVVFSLDDPASFVRAGEYLTEVENIRGTRFHQLPLILVANKCDLPRLILKSKVQALLNKPELVGHLAFVFLEVSAKEGTNVFEIFGKLAKLGGIVDEVVAKPKPIVKPPPLHRRLSLQIESSMMNLKMSSANVGSCMPVGIQESANGSEVGNSSVSSAGGASSPSTSSKQDSSDGESGQSPQRTKGKSKYSPKKLPQKIKRHSATKTNIAEVQECFIM